MGVGPCACGWASWGLLPAPSSGSVLTAGSVQPTVRFAEDTLLLPPGEDGESEEGQPEAPWPLPGGRQRLIRKDTPHYKKHFKISKLPQPEAVVALLQGAQPDGEGLGAPSGWHNGPHEPWAPRAEEEEEEEEEEPEEEEEAVEAEPEEEEEEQAATLVPVPSVKVGFCSQTYLSWAVPAPPGRAAVRAGLSGSWHSSSGSTSQAWRTPPRPADSRVFLGCVQTGVPGSGSCALLPGFLLCFGSSSELPLGHCGPSGQSCPWPLPGDMVPRLSCASGVELASGARA